MLLLSVSLCQIKNRVIICSVVRCSVDAAIMQCLYEMVRGFIAVSYTHLDVYKRQPLGSRSLLAGNSNSATENFKNEYCGFD